MLMMKPTIPTMMGPMMCQNYIRGKEELVPRYMKPAALAVPCQG